MSDHRHHEARNTAEQIVHLTRASSSAPAQAGLTPTQWMALRYFSRANQKSRTMSAFADYHGTTRGTVSQTVKGLVKQGYLHRRRLDSDGRSAELSLTEAGRTALTEDPFLQLVEAIEELSDTARRHVASALDRAMTALAGKTGKPRFGVCARCGHLCEAIANAPSYHCRLFGESVENAEIEEICANFSPRGG